MVQKWPQDLIWWVEEEGQEVKVRLENRPHCLGGKPKMDQVGGKEDRNS